MMKQLKTERKQHIAFLKYTLVFFVFVTAYNFLIVNRCSLWQADYMTYSYHLVDFSFGFGSRLLPGAIYHLFFKEVLPAQLNIYLTVLMLLLFLAVSALLAKVILAQPDKSSANSLFVLSLFLLAGPCTFAIFTKLLGIIDVYLVFFSVLGLVCFSNKYLKYLLPLLFIGMILVHTAALISYILFFALIIFYEIVKSDKAGRRGYIILAAISFVAVVGLVLLLAKYERASLRYTMEEFDRELERRNHFDNVPYTVYYNYYFYDTFEIRNYSFEQARNTYLLPPDTSFLPAGITALIKKFYSIIVLEQNIYKAYPQFYLQFVLILALLAPLLFLFYRYWGKKAKQARGALKIFYIAAMLQFPLSMLGCFFSADISRFYTHAFLVQSALFLYVLYKEKDSFDIRFESKAFVRNILIILYFAVYAFTYVDPYQ